MSRPLDEIDRILGADPDGDLAGAVACFEPRLPCDPTGAAAELLWARYRERWSEYWGTEGDRIRLLEASGAVVVDRDRGVVTDPISGAPLRQLPDPDVHPSSSQSPTSGGTQ